MLYSFNRILKLICIRKKKIVIIIYIIYYLMVNLRVMINSFQFAVNSFQTKDAGISG